MIDLSDELLMAYVDGQLDKPQAAVVTRILRDDRDLAVRVSRLQETQAQLLDTFGALLREGVNSGGRTKRRGHGPSAGIISNPNLMMAAAALILAIGIGLGLGGAFFSGLLNRTTQEIVQLPPSNWPEDVAEFHSFFTKDAIQVSPESQSNPEMVKFQLAQLFNDMPVPDFSELGLKFVRGQTLSYRGNRVMQLLYTGKRDPLVALYIGAGGLDMPMTPGRFGDVNTVSWSANEVRYVIASDMPHQSLQALAVIAKSQVDKK
jgi:anti-sigma factor RsiW